MMYRPASYRALGPAVDDSFTSRPYLWVGEKNKQGVMPHSRAVFDETIGNYGSLQRSRKVLFTVCNDICLFLQPGTGGAIRSQGDHERGTEAHELCLYPKVDPCEIDD